MKLETLKSEKFSTLNKNQMSVIKGGEYQNTKAIITNNGGSGSPAKTEVDDRHQINYIRNLHGNITGHTLGKAEYLIDGVWCVGS